MRATVNKQEAELCSRIVLVSFTSLSLRLMENWRRLIADVSGKVPDYERTMILGAIITISTERLLRTELKPEHRNLLSPIPAEVLSIANTTSIAAAVGLNRETVRRKINELIADELVVRSEDGGVQIGPGLLELTILRETLQAQLDLLRRTVNLLSNFSALEFKSTDISG